ncbi:MAG TPA: hypothetical protein VIF37_02655 [Methylobacter sp.]|jgi:hypothetical protein
MKKLSLVQIACFSMLELLTVPVNADPCYTEINNVLTQLSNDTLASCIRALRAAKANGSSTGAGQWGTHSVVVDINGSAYVDGQFVGVAPSSQEEGTASPFNRWDGQEQSNWNYFRYNQPK